MPLQRREFQPKSPPTDPRAERFVPKFIYCDPNDPEPVQIREDFYGSRRKLRLGIVGAGPMCLNFLHFLYETIPKDSIDVVVYDKNETVGGVWASTTYPGARCDSPSWTYMFPWRPTVWSEFHAAQSEIRDYFQTVARENDWEKLINFRHEVVHASWTDQEAQWTLTVKDLTSGRTVQDKFDLFLEFDGSVRSPQIRVPGIEAYKGEVVHSAEWRNDIVLDNKNVLLLGYGSTGVQLAPVILPSVTKLYTVLRQGIYLTPDPAAAFAYNDAGINFHYSEEQKALLRDPDIQLAYRKAIDDRSNRQWDAVINGSQTSKMASEGLKHYMQMILKDKPEVYDILEPSYDFLCRRPTITWGYLEALADPKTTVIKGEPLQYTETGFIDREGTEHHVDLIIAATGYDQTSLPLFPRTVNGEDIASRWIGKGGAHTYMALCEDGMPNHFHSSPAYAPTYRNWIQITEPYAKYMTKVINKIQLERIVTFTPKEKAVKHWVRHANTFQQRLVTSQPCGAWYKIGDRPQLWPGSHSHYMQVLENPRFEDFDMVYEDEENMFSYFGNGLTLHPEACEEDDSTWYLGKPSRKVTKEELDKLHGSHGTPHWPPNIDPARKDIEGQVRSSL